MKKIHLFIVLFLLFLGQNCQFEDRNESQSIEAIAASKEVMDYINAFEGRGDQTDDSRPTPPEKTLQNFLYPEDLSLELLASEPLVHQPVEINFDHRGRLWVVQYGQYPYPAGLKITGYDYHLRAQFDTIPTPPPDGEKGADKITLLEDTDGDGRFDQARDAITGLNIATAVTWGRQRIWVLNPPYLLAYPDPDGDGFPDGAPSVHLRGFGLEDTHAVANSLRWGPDGWLYGAQGSTTTATISSSVTKDVHFKGQAIWRYHPESEIFELFAEGGGNTFHLEIDDKGRIYSGHNGARSRGQYYKQGSYYAKNWGKHGALTNPYSFGYFPHMDLEGKPLRFTHAFIRYGGGSLPKRYDDALIGINPLHNFLQVSDFQPQGSTFRTIDREKILATNDHWFRPVDIKAGPDGNVYLADWYDSRLSHIDPRDTWHRASGRIYRLKARNKAPQSIPDISKMTTSELVALLKSTNRWLRQQALRQFGDRKNPEAVQELRPLLLEETGQIALESLWAIHLSAGLNDSLAKIGLQHSDPFVRLWSVRLLGDQKIVSETIAQELKWVATREKHPEVKSQLASTSKRLTAEVALPILQALILNSPKGSDPHNPLLIWWALENQIAGNHGAVLNLFQNSKIWETGIAQNVLLKRLMQRFVMGGTQEDLNAAATLLKIAPSAQWAQPLLAGLSEGLRGQSMEDLPGEISETAMHYQRQLGGNTLAMELMQGNGQAFEEVFRVLLDAHTPLNRKLEYIEVLGQVKSSGAVPPLLQVVESGKSSPALRQAALMALQNYPNEDIGVKVAEWYPDRLRADADVRTAALELLVSRSNWAKVLLEKINRTRQISSSDLPLDKAQRLLLLNDESIDGAAYDLWPELHPVTSVEKQGSINRLKKVIAAAPGRPDKGKPIFDASCGLCHQLFGSGGHIGPDLTGYERKNLDYLLLHTIDPNADIREGFVNYLVTTKDGQHLAGRIAERSALTIELRLLNDQIVQIPSERILEMQAQPVSIMPERLLDGLSNQDLRDLFAYLMR